MISNQSFPGSQAEAVSSRLPLPSRRSKTSVPGGTAFSGDYRFMAFSDSDGNVVVFDARAGKAAGGWSGQPVLTDVGSRAAVARAEVVESLAWFLVRPFEHALNDDDVTRGQRDEMVQSALASLEAALGQLLLGAGGAIDCLVHIAEQAGCFTTGAAA